MTATTSTTDDFVVSPHRVSTGRGGAGNMVAPEEIKDEMKKASCHDEHDALADHRRRSSSCSLHSGGSGTSKTEAIKYLFRRGSKNRKSSEDEIGNIQEEKA